jgi:CheY-like chemotaxis protein
VPASGYDEHVSGEIILVVEDEAITALHLRQELTHLGYQVTAAAASGEEAVRLAEDLSPNLVLMDVKLAGPMDGIEASRQIQEKSGVPVIYLTAYPEVFMGAPARMQQPGICISKPFSRSALQVSIDIALRGSKAFCSHC